ncbi:unnamed protein product [Dibothriocephalus latus]|uniref:Uncharacterized protein n=1 Tax=Dibothriocephalus latus TaxID=60516 RepID=A0A3P6RFU8_DIBLA|nr:unnamed protein product [Dibothriocephalus latus]
MLIEVATCVNAYPLKRVHWSACLRLANQCPRRLSKHLRAMTAFALTTPDAAKLEDGLRSPECQLPRLTILHSFCTEYTLPSSWRFISSNTLKKPDLRIVLVSF